VGFILFKRNCDTPAQIQALTEELRDSIDDPLAPVLIDQEGGRVARLKPPHWRAAPAAGRFGALYADDRDRALAACRVNAELIGHELAALGIDVDCLPMLDVRRADSDPQVIGDRAFGEDPAQVAALGRAALEGLRAAGVEGVIKHLPGHGRALSDSHRDLPRVTASMAELRGTDFVPFRAMRDQVLGMTAHVVYDAIDPEACATLSPAAIRLIRDELGFDGLLMTDDLSMGALTGPMGARACAALAAGCDVILHCNGEMDEMQAVAAAVPALSGDASRRAARAEAARPAPSVPTVPTPTGEVLHV